MSVNLWSLPSSEENAIKFFQVEGLILSSAKCSNNYDMTLNIAKNSNAKWRCYVRPCLQSNLKIVYCFCLNFQITFKIYIFDDNKCFLSVDIFLMIINILYQFI